MSKKEQTKAGKKAENPSWQSKLPADYKHLDEIKVDRRNAKYFSNRFNSFNLYAYLQYFKTKKSYNNNILNIFREID